MCYNCVISVWLILVTSDYNWLLLVTSGYKWLQVGTIGYQYKWLQVITTATSGYKCLGYNWVHVVKSG